MASSIEARGGLVYGWDLGETGWKSGMDSNLLKISRLCIGGLSVKSRSLTAPPSTFAEGDAYIVGGTPTGDWASSSVGAVEDDVVVYDGADWVAYTPIIGWQAYVIAEEKITVFKAAGWSAGVAI